MDDGEGAQDFPKSPVETGLSRKEHEEMAEWQNALALTCSGPRNLYGDWVVTGEGLF